MKVYLEAVGCRLNQSEIETIARQLLTSGHVIVNDPSEADKVILNTCVVTHEATKDSRTLARRYHRANPSAELILTGCYVTIAPEELTGLRGVGRIVPNEEKEHLAKLVDPALPAIAPDYDKEPILRDLWSLNFGKTRAFVKVQDGCDNRCTFCITTIARGSGKSRAIGDIISEIQALAAAGYKEAVLTGVHLGSYGRDLELEEGLLHLVEAILAHTDIPRLRLSSLEPWDIPEDFFKLWTDPRLLPHLHVPLQSGSDKVLKSMGRRTTRAEFRRLVRQARESIPNLNLSTDLIAGFPGESKRDFEETLAFVGEMAFSRLHVFTFSGRPGTVAEKMDGQLPKPLRKSRARALIERGKELSLAFHRSNEGRTAEVLWEYAERPVEDDLTWIGYSDNYVRIRTQSSADLSNQITSTVMTSPTAEGMLGTIVR